MAHVRFVARTRVMCQAGRARTVADVHGDIVARAALGRRARVRAAAGVLDCRAFFSDSMFGLCCPVMGCVVLPRDDYERAFHVTAAAAAAAAAAAPAYAHELGRIPRSNYIGRMLPRTQPERQAAPPGYVCKGGSDSLLAKVG